MMCSYVVENVNGPPVDAAIQGSTVDVAQYSDAKKTRSEAPTSRLHGYAFGPTVVSIPPPTAHTFAHRSVCAVNPLPITMETIAQDIEHLTER